MLAQELKDDKPNNDTESQNFVSWKGLTRRMHRKTRSSQAFRSVATSRKRVQRSKRFKDMKTRRSEQGYLFSKPGTRPSSSALDVHLRYIPACKDLEPRHIPRGRKVWTQGVSPCTSGWRKNKSAVNTMSRAGCTDQQPEWHQFSQPAPAQSSILAGKPWTSPSLNNSWH